MTPREEAALEAQVALGRLLLVGHQSGALWPDDERVLRSALSIAERLARTAGGAS